jgi:hypothetical protein
MELTKFLVQYSHVKEQIKTAGETFQPCQDHVELTLVPIVPDKKERYTPNTYPLRHDLSRQKIDRQSFFIRRRFGPLQFFDFEPQRFTNPIPIAAWLSVSMDTERVKTLYNSLIKLIDAADRTFLIITHDNNLHVFSFMYKSFIDLDSDDDDDDQLVIKKGSE